jgi:ribosomal protein L7/L12
MNINEENVSLIINLLAKEVESLREQLSAERRESNICRQHATDLREQVSRMTFSIQSYAGETADLAQENRQLREATGLKSALKPEELLQLFPTYQDAAKHLAALHKERIKAIKALRDFTRGVKGYPIGLKEAKDMIEEQRELLGLNSNFTQQ